MPQRFGFFTAKPMRVRQNRPSAHRRGYGGKAWEALRLECLKRDNWQCRQCQRVCTGPKEAHADHIVPKRLNGPDTLENLQTLCIRCHYQKGKAGL